MTWTLPSGMIVDTSKTQANGREIDGAGMFNDSSASNNIVIQPQAASTTTFSVMQAGVNSGLQGSSLANADVTSFKAFVPILGWSSSQVLSQDAETRPVYASYGMSSSSTSSTITAADTLMDFDTKVLDSHGAVTTGASWKFTAPVPGLYRMRYTVTGSSTTADLAIIGSVYKNGSKIREQYREKGNTTSARVPDMTYEFEIWLNARDYFAPYIYSSSSNTIQKSVTYNWIDVALLQGPSQIA